MRFLLLILSLFLHFNASGYNINSPQENHANKILTPENEDFNERSCILFRFQGQYEDYETGLYYNRFRYYDSDSGSYISQDPIGLDGGFGLYNYIDDPNQELDLFGLSGKKSCYSGKRGVAKAKADLKKNGFTVLSEEVTMRVKGKSPRIRADIIAMKDGKLYVFEVKNGTGRLTNNQNKTGMFNKGSANTNGGLGGGLIKPSAGTQGTFDIATKNPNKTTNITTEGFNTTNQSATFYLLNY